MHKKITSSDFEKILGFKIDEKIKKQIENVDLQYRDLSNGERDQYIMNFIGVLTNDITKSGKHRISEWESGWSENLKNFSETRNIDNLIPKYHGKNKIVRWMGEPIMPLTENFDYKIHTLFVDSIITKYTKDLENLFEFGCGPGYHLVRINKLLPKLNLYGLDWTEASQKIIKVLNDNLKLSINPINFDFFDPDYSIPIPEKSCILTIAALEQIGENYNSFLDFLIEKKPNLCVHMEPIDELLNPDLLMDSLSIKYFRKRNYLKNFLPKLESLEKEKKIEIIDKRRIYSGSYYIEGHSLIIWKPL